MAYLSCDVVYVGTCVAGEPQALLSLLHNQNIPTCGTEEEHVANGLFQEQLDDDRLAHLNTRVVNVGHNNDPKCLEIYVLTTSAWTSGKQPRGGNVVEVAETVQPLLMLVMIQ